jgi:hypothetical protein
MLTKKKTSMKIAQPYAAITLLVKEIAQPCAAITLEVNNLHSFVLLSP